MMIHLQYGRGTLAIEAPADRVRVLAPRHAPGLPDEAAAWRAAVRAPLEAPPLREAVSAGERLAVVVPDATRPFPSRRILPWLFAELAHVPAECLTVIVGTGSHRASTPAEREALFGPDILNRYRVVDHDARDDRTLAVAGRRPDGGTVQLNRHYVEADRRIILGFIEPHFMAGFSGGYKAVVPGIADLDTILTVHRAAVIGDPRSTWGRLEDNPIQAEVRRFGALCPADFCVNVTLNQTRRITGFFCGAVHAAHAAGCAAARAQSMVECEAPFPLVITTNGGYPLDQNLYQTVKGMSAAARIVAPGGRIVVASECSDGFPAHGHFTRLLFEHASPRALLETVCAPGSRVPDQWEAQLLAMILEKARVSLYSALPAADVRRAYLEPIERLETHVAEAFRALPAGATAAVLPEGPLTIPCLRGS